MDSTADQPTELFIGVYLAAGLGQTIFVYVRTVALLAWVCVNASNQLHESMLKSVLRAPVSFFDTTPMGRILNRFTRDVESLDTQLPVSVQQLAGCACITFGTVIFVVFAHPYIA